MSIVVFDPDSTEDVDFNDRMRHPAAADPAGGMWLSDTEPSFVDADALRKGRLAKLRAWMREAGYGAVVLFDPYNQRYATGSRNMFGYFLRNSTRYFFIPTEGPIVLFEYPQSYHVSMVLDTVDEARPSKLVWSSVSGRDDETAGPFADEIVDLLQDAWRRLDEARARPLQPSAGAGAGKARLRRQGLPGRDPGRARGQDAGGGQMPAGLDGRRGGRGRRGARGDQARRFGERPLRHHVSRGDPAGRRVHRDAAADLRPAHQSLVQRGERPQAPARRAGRARYRHDRLLRLLLRFLAHLPLRAGQADRLPEDRSTGWPTTRCSTTSAIVKPGMAFREIAEKAWKIPDRFVDQRYTSVMHGVGMHGETPFIAHAMDYDDLWPRGHIVPGMVVSVESYIGEKGGREGVKLEDEILITETGTELLSRFPYEDDFLDGQI